MSEHEWKRMLSIFDEVIQKFPPARNELRRELNEIRLARRRW
jgi:hypothetical protein